jgi:hypothetical protein
MTILIRFTTLKHDVIQVSNPKVDCVGRACGTHGRGEKSVEDFGGKSRKKELLGRPRRRWEVGFRMDLRGLAGGIEWIQVAQDRDRWRAVLNAAMNLRVLAPRS